MSTNQAVTPNPAPKDKQKDRRKPQGSTAPLAVVAASHIPDTMPAPSSETTVQPGTGEVLAPSPMLNDESAKELAKVAHDDQVKRMDAMNAFLEELNPALRADVRKEDKAFDKDIQAAAGKVTSAMSHLYRIHGLLDSEQYRHYGIAKVQQGYVTAGTLYTLTEKIKVFETLKIAESARHSIMAYSGGDSVIIRRELTEDERKAWKTEHPGTKVPRGKYVESPYFARAIQVVEAPAKWTAESSDSFAGQVIRLAAKLRGKDRVAGQTDGDKDTRATVRLGNALDNLEKLIIGENVDGEIKGQLKFEDASVGFASLIEVAESMIKAVLTRLPLAEANKLYESVDEIFTERIQALEASQKSSKTAA